MQQKTHRPLFQQAISAVRKQVDSNPPTNPKVPFSLTLQKPEQNQNNNPTNNQYEDMSSGEQQRLKELGVDLSKTKRIAKDNGGSQDRRDGNERKGGNGGKGAEKEWRHDKYRAHQQSSSSKATSSYNPRPSTSHNSTQPSKPAPSFLIKFPTVQQYSKIYQLVKSQKAFISEIDEHHIKFTKEFAWNTCKKILKGEGVQFDDGTGGLTGGDSAKDNTQKESIFSRLK